MRADRFRWSLSRNLKKLYILTVASTPSLDLYEGCITHICDERFFVFSIILRIYYPATAKWLTSYNACYVLSRILTCRSINTINRSNVCWLCIFLPPQGTYVIPVISMYFTCLSSYFTALHTIVRFIGTIIYIIIIKIMIW